MATAAELADAYLKGAADTRAAAAGMTPRALLHEASLKTETREVPARSVTAMPRQATDLKSADRPVTAAKPVALKSADRPGLAAAKSTAQADRKRMEKKSVDKPPVAATGSVTKPVRVAKNDPLAPLPEKRPSQSSKDKPQAQ